MEINLLYLLIIIIFTVIILFAFWRYRDGGSAEVQGPLGTRMKVSGKGKNNPAEGINITDATARKGGLYTDDETGRVNVQRVDVQDDIMVTSKKPRGNE
jgi:hypothetical protein